MTQAGLDPMAAYQRRATALAEQKRGLQVRAARLLAVLLLGVALAAAGVAAAYRHMVGPPLAAAALCLSLSVIPFLLRNRRSLSRASRLGASYDAALRRVGHQPAARPETGERFRQRGHGYDRDLNILGPDSLFELLVTTRTEPGQRALAEMLLTPPENTAERQQAIQELTSCLELRESIVLLGPSATTPVPHDTFDLWLAEPSGALPAPLRTMLGMTVGVGVLLTVVWAANYLPTEIYLRNLAAVLAVQGAIALRYRARVVPVLNATLRLPTHLQILRDGLALLQAQTFRAQLLQDLQRRSAPAAAPLAELQRYLILVEQRKQEWFYLPSLLVCAGTQAAVRLDAWKQAHGAGLKDWLETWSAFDALSALATYAFEHPAHCYPELLPSGCPATFEATGLTHALLPGAVPNDVELGSVGPGDAGLANERRFYLISGSNMSGKSTLLRAIGLAVVLARAGAPVPATRCRLTRLELGVSLTLTDSLAEGHSRFLAEALRLRDILTLARTRAALFLIDELFAGTNSVDRRTAAESVLNALLAAGAIGALSTHDLALTALARAENGGENRHMGSSDADEPLGFDYLLKPGINPATNALAFLRLLGLADG